MNILISCLFILTSVFANDQATHTDKSLKKGSIPSFLVEATPKGQEIEDVEYFSKTYSNGTTAYELKYENKDMEISLTFSSDGVLIEKEEDIKFSSLPSGTKEKIEAYLSQKFQKYEISETELRTTKEKKKLIDVEVIHHKGTGLKEVSFTEAGDYVSEKDEKVPAIETLN